MTKGGWPEKIEHELVKHELVRIHGRDVRDEMPSSRSLHFAECNFNLWPKCASKKNYEEGRRGTRRRVRGATGKGNVCGGQVSRKL